MYCFSRCRVQYDARVRVVVLSTLALVALRYNLCRVPLRGGKVERSPTFKPQILYRVYLALIVYTYDGRRGKDHYS